MKKTITLIFKKGNQIMKQTPLTSAKETTIKLMLGCGWTLWKQLG